MIGSYGFQNVSIPYVFEVNESISRSFTMLLCLRDLENPGQLPVLQVLKGNDDWSYGFSKFLYSLRFPGRGIHFAQFHKANMFE